MHSENALFSKLTSIMQAYNAEKTHGSVVNYRNYSALKTELAAMQLDEGTQSWDSIWKSVETYLHYSVKTAHPQYFNQLWAGQSNAALVGSVIEVLANTSMYTYEVAPVATLIENEVLSRFRSVFGFNDGEAQITTGGSNSNYVALLLALHKKFPLLKNEGLHGLPRVSVFVSEEAHYSMDKAMVMSGIGLNSLVKVPVDETGAMRTGELERLIQLSKDEGCIPVSIIGTAGTTVRGAFDDFQRISSTAQAHDCWFHIDGAWGGAVAFSKQEKRLLSGSNLADSLSWDAHKMLGVPLMCGVLFVRESGSFDRVCNLGDTSYIFHESAERQDLGPYSLQCGRRVDALKMWLEYIFYGNEGFENRIDNFIKLSKHAELRIHNEPTLELQTTRWINNICFRSIVGDGVDSNTFNKQVRQSLYESGESLVNIAYIQDDLTIRLIITNKDVTEQDIDTFFDNWLQTASKVAKELTQCV